MTSKDYLIIGVELTNLAKVRGLLSHYDNKVARLFATYTLNQLGVTDEEYDYDVSWNDKVNQVEVRALLNQPVKMEISGEKFTLQKNESILLGRSIKFTEYTVTKLLSDVGFRTELLTTSEDRGYLLTMIQPTRYSA